MSLYNLSSSIPMPVPPNPLHLSNQSFADQQFLINNLQFFNAQNLNLPPVSPVSHQTSNIVNSYNINHGQSNDYSNQISLTPSYNHPNTCSSYSTAATPASSLTNSSSPVSFNESTPPQTPIDSDSFQQISLQPYDSTTTITSNNNNNNNNNFNTLSNSNQQNDLRYKFHSTNQFQNQFQNQLQSQLQNQLILPSSSDQSNLLTESYPNSSSTLLNSSTSLNSSTFTSPSPSASNYTYISSSDSFENSKSNSVPYVVNSNDFSSTSPCYPIPASSILSDSFMYSDKVATSPIRYDYPLNNSSSNNDSNNRNNSNNFTNNDTNNNLGNPNYYQQKLNKNLPLITRKPTKMQKLIQPATSLNYNFNYNYITNNTTNNITTNINNNVNNVTNNITNNADNNADSNATGVNKSVIENQMLKTEEVNLPVSPVIFSDSKTVSRINNKDTETKKNRNTKPKLNSVFKISKPSQVNKSYSNIKTEKKQQISTKNPIPPLEALKRQNTQPGPIPASDPKVTIEKLTGDEIIEFEYTKAKKRKIFKIRCPAHLGEKYMEILENYHKRKALRHKRDSMFNSSSVSFCINAFDSSNRQTNFRFIDTKEFNLELEFVKNQDEILKKLSKQFIDNNAIYPNAMGSDEEYKGNRGQYERFCNIIGLKLSYLNTELRGKKGLLQRAVDTWKNTRKNECFQSRRVRRQIKSASKSSPIAKAFQK
ncbi:uncharacterized protein ASCRUDRAFT_15858 [Ascoidea rubescens DSM 1968]|uniref:DUF8032 domain-containing protein n=1 Tax=Ascoidea rubescens DSM 1968 TaxID=1344418 RepID=A0A1D2V975_9ASCO|nr:hypothetical protein ASCRUDRAFT_15858 [Ascoidea rubescens DSM 1968]ODV58055.1 hypothetical protein ASCRUDRAFT_15858 [Ascoidea rubescens DSM 1968]